MGSAEDEAKGAYPFLRLLLVEKDHHNQLCEILLKVLNTVEMAPEKIYDLVHDWRLARRAACDEELERIYDKLYHEIASNGGPYTERNNFQRAQASRRRHGESRKLKQ